MKMHLHCFTLILTFIIASGVNEEIKCKALNSKPRTLFMNYHITHHAGTTMYDLAGRANLSRDGVSGNYNIVIGETVDEVFQKWMTPCNFSAYPRKNHEPIIGPTDGKSWASRNHGQDHPVLFS